MKGGGILCYILKLEFTTSVIFFLKHLFCFFTSYIKQTNINFKAFLHCKEISHIFHLDRLLTNLML